MPDTLHHNPQRAAHLINEWDDCTKPALDRVELAALHLLDALDALRTEILFSDQRAKIEATACDLSAAVLDTINDVVGKQRRELDDAGRPPSNLHIDLTLLEEAHQEWEARWRARQ